MVTRPFWATKRELVELPHRGGPQPHEAFVLVAVDLRHRREQLGVEDDADLAADVVEHAVGVHGAVALAEDDVAFHVDFERQIALLRGAGWDRCPADAPDDDAVGFDVDVAERAERFRQAFDAEALDRRRSRRLAARRCFRHWDPAR